MELQTVSKKERVRRKFTDVGHLCPARRTLTNMLRSFTLLARAVLLASLIGTACAQAPDKSCCVSVYGTGPEEGNNRATVCDSCAKLATFECRPSHAPADGTVSDTSTDCISFAYADEATCLAVDGAQAWWTSSDNDGNGCPATTTSFPHLLRRHHLLRPVSSSTTPRMARAAWRAGGPQTRTAPTAILVRASPAATRISMAASTLRVRTASLSSTPPRLRVPPPEEPPTLINGLRL